MERKGGREGSGKEGRNEEERRAYLNGLKFLLRHVKACLNQFRVTRIDYGIHY